MNNIVFEYHIPLIDRMPNGISYEELFKPIIRVEH
jgi:hypothetical protein